MDTELLAPAGDLDAAYSAFYYGADAIYLGLRQFSARAQAVNFSPEDLDEITAFAHAHGKKVYVALNTLLQENELPQLMTHLDVCARTHVDALIVQDTGVARVIKKAYPELVLHASTQLAVHNTAGALTLKRAGFERVVVARELSFDEIRKIREQADMEVETFVHGALCYSYSGLCSFSSMTTGRSANRGKCVYACRASYRLHGKQFHPFSMKDFALEKDAAKLTGFSLKIEGRKKNALYVGAVTDYYRRILDTGKADARLSDNLKQIFARPWTKLHFNGKNRAVIEPDFVGHRGLLIGHVEKVVQQKVTFKTTHPIERFDGIQIDVAGQEKPFGFSAEQLTIGTRNVFVVPAGKTATVALPPKSPFITKGAPVYLASTTRVKAAYPFERPKKGAYQNKTPIAVTLYIEPKLVTAVCGETAVIKKWNTSPAQNLQKMADGALNAFSKTGDTPFTLSHLDIHNPDQLFVPVSVLNELRRELFEKCRELRSTAQTRQLPAVHNKAYANAPKWVVKSDDLALLKALDLSQVDEIVYEITPKTTAADLAALPQHKLRLALPVIIRSNAYQAVIKTLWDAGFIKWSIGNIGGFALLPKKADLVTDDTLSVLNTQAAAFFTELGARQVTFSVEDTKANIRKLAPQTGGTLVVYQDVPLFLSANCVRPNDCAHCSGKREEYPLTDSKERYTVISENCLTTVVKNTPYYIGDLVSDLTLTTRRIDFCHKKYTPENAQRILLAALSEKPLKGCYRGNFEKSFA